MAVTALRAKYPLKMLLSAARIKRTAYYKYINAKPKDAATENLIRHMHTKYQAKQGVMQLKQSLFREYGLTLNHKKIRRILRESGLFCEIRKAKQIKDSEQRVIQENILNREFSSEEPNKKFVTDFTLISCGSKTYYLSAVLDLFDKMPAVWYLTDKCDKSLSLATLEMLAKKVDLTGSLIHSDQGVQYTCKAYCEALTNKGIIQSMSRRGNCWDNAVIENFFGILKTESIYLHPKRCLTFESLKELLEEEFDYYINHRPQKSLGGMPPRDYRIIHNLS